MEDTKINVPYPYSLNGLTELAYLRGYNDGHSSAIAFCLNLIKENQITEADVKRVIDEAVSELERK